MLPLLNRSALCCTLLMTGCNNAPAPEHDAAPEQSEIAAPTNAPTSHTSVFVCGEGADNFQVVLHEEPNRVSLWLPDRLGGPYLVVHRAATDSAERYAGSGVTIETAASSATLDAAGSTFTCTRDNKASIWEEAKLTGASFRAVGNEPGWSLEMRPDAETKVGQRGRFVYNYGEAETMLVALTETSDQTTGRTVWTGQSADNRPFSITLEIGPCTDSMSGESFETSVTVTLADTTYRGCGRPLH